MLMREKVEIDQIDIRILRILSQDGRRSFTDLSQDLGVSVGMVRNRYNRLVHHGVLHIIGWTDPVKKRHECVCPCHAQSASKPIYPAGR